MTRRITIDGIIFNVEPLGYEILRSYLQACNQLNPQKKAQWEEQAAEHLLQQLTGGSSVTTLEHVESIGEILPQVSSLSDSKRGGKRHGPRFLLKMSFGLW